MNIFASNYDIVFFGIIAFSAILAFIRGGVAEILSLSSWFIALWFMHKFGTTMDKYIPLSITNNLARSAIIFILSFIFIAIIIAILKKILANLIDSIGLGGLNYLIGILFGVIRGLLICALLIIVVEMLNLDSSHSWQNSKLYPVLLPIVTWIADSVPEKIRHLPSETVTQQLKQTTLF